MSETSANNKRIAKNTLFLYLRMLLTMFVGLYSSRIILRALGVSDYGLYNVVGGFVTMLSFLSSTMTNGTQRFLSFEIGKKDDNRLSIVFANALTLHSVMALLLLIIAESIGLWFLYTYMSIPYGRETAAFWVYQFSVVTFLVSVIQVPFMSAIVSHERMDIYAYMSIYDAVMKLIVIYLLQIGNYDKLIFYSFLICTVQFSSALLYNYFARKHFSECRFRFSFNKGIFSEMSRFSLWTLIGAFGYTANGQGVNVLLNIFYGTAVNAARGISFQVTNIIAGFARNIQTASNPQIIKFYAEGKVVEMERLANRASKFCAFLLLTLMLPVFTDTEYILELWLGKAPERTPIFLRIVLIQSLIQSMSGPVITVTHAGGKLKMPNLTGGIAIVMALPLSFVALMFGCSPETVFIINIVPWLFECFFDTFYAQKYTGFSFRTFYREVYFVVLVVASFSLSIAWFICKNLPMNGFMGLILHSVVCLLVSVTVIWTIGLKKQEQEYIYTTATKRILNRI